MGPYTRYVQNCGNSLTQNAPRRSVLTEERRGVLTPMRFILVVFLAGSLVGLSPPAKAQQLMWEQAFLHSNSAGGEALQNFHTVGTQRILLSGVFVPSRSGATGCRPVYQAYYRTYALNGTLQREQLGRNLGAGESDFFYTGHSGGWWAAPGFACANGSSSARAYVQRITAAGDTGRAWLLAAAPPRTTARSVLLHGARLIVAGHVQPAGAPNGQAQQYQLTCFDTLGNIRWQRSYPRAPQALDYASAVVPTPRGGYLISGDGYVLPGYKHYVVETDSLGNFRRSRLLLPLGPNFPNGFRAENSSNALALPNAGGYLLTGTADSLVNGLSKKIGYVLRLDTALNVVWTYRHPPSLAGTGATSNYAYRLRYLPNGSVGVMLSDVRLSGTPSVYLAQLDIATGQRVAFYTLSSNTQMAVIPYDWQWVGDGTLLLAGKSQQAGVAYIQSYLARFDFRGTPLAAARPGAVLAAGGASLWAYPNPAQGTTTVQVSGLGRRAGRLELLDALGRAVRTQAVAGDGDHALDLKGLAPGVYAARLLDAATGRRLGGCKVVVAP